MKRKIISVVLAIILLQSYAYSVIAATQAELEEKKSNLEQKVNNAKEEQAELKEELDEEMKAISSLDYEISQAQDEVDKLEGQINELQKSISESEKQIEEKQKEYEKNESLLEERLVVMYEMGDTSFLDMLFTSASLVDFLSNYYAMSQLVQFDADLLQSIEDAKVEIENTKAKLEEEKAQVETLKSEKEEKANSLKTKRAARQEKANTLNAEQKALQSEIDSYNRSINQLKEDIKNLTPEIVNTKFDGSFIWPCNNKIITSTVKQRWGRWHKGIDIGARYENVYASASGYAYTYVNPGGYGNYIIIRHGNGYATLYGHLDSYKVSSGQYVSQGQVIATSGNTGGSTGAHLHFEIRRPGSSEYFSASFLNPLEYLPGGYSFAAGAQTPS